MVATTIQEENKYKYIIVGGGLSGLVAAKELLDKGEDSFLIVEASDKVGGRIRTDKLDGYLLDRGFQVFIDSYPEAIDFFDYDELQLKPFLPGALVRYGDDFHLLSDPLRRPQDLLASLLNPVGSIADKIKVWLSSITSSISTIRIVLCTYSQPFASKSDGSVILTYMCHVSCVMCHVSCVM
jgi:uncharacterized protein with NAD-binding domain and iron-sulfur cluster